MPERERQDKATRDRAEASRAHFGRLLQAAKDSGKLIVVHVK